MTDDQDQWTVAGNGTAIPFPEAIEGRLREITGPVDVLQLSEEMRVPGFEDPVILVHEAGGTTLGPLLGSIRAVVSTKGTVGAHIALLAKEYGCPCVVGAALDRVPADGDLVSVRPDGSIWIATRS